MPIFKRKLQLDWRIGRSFKGKYYSVVIDCNIQVEQHHCLIGLKIRRRLTGRIFFHSL